MPGTARPRSLLSSIAVSTGIIHSGSGHGQALPVPLCIRDTLCRALSVARIRDVRGSIQRRNGSGSKAPGSKTTGNSGRASPMGQRMHSLRMPAGDRDGDVQTVHKRGPGSIGFLKTDPTGSVYKVQSPPRRRHKFGTGKEIGRWGDTFFSPSTE